jgi:hypothetical protein
MLSAVAMRAAAQFKGRNIVIRRSRVVHAAATSKWMAGIELPAPACHVGVAGWAIEDLHPTTEPVSCRRCLRSQGHRAVPELTLVRGGQMTLPLDVD